MVPRDAARDPGVFLEMLKRESVTVLNQTPSAFYRLAELGGTEPANGSGLRCLRYIIFGGEALKPRKLLVWALKYPGTALINMYGITETTVHVTFRLLKYDDLLRDDPVIGTPIPTLRVYVLDKNRALVPLGVAGELAVGGDGVCRGYLNRPELTHERFAAVPDLPGEQVYLSGDKARLAESGDTVELLYMGRIDQQVKIRGFRIEPAEIENRLLQHEEVSEAVVVPLTDPNGQTALCAYLVTAAPDRENFAGIQEQLAAGVPDYMVPSYWVRVEKIPLTANDKLDRRALPLPWDDDTAQGETVLRDTAGENPLQRALLECTGEVLKIKEPGLRDHFFRIGGDSIKAIQLAIALKSRGFDIDIRHIFMSPILENMAAHITASESPANPVERRRSKIEAGAEPGGFTLSRLDDKGSSPGNEEEIESVFDALEDIFG